MPSRDRRHLFELLTLEGAQAGLSWMTILRKREGYEQAFADFEPERVAAFGPDDVDRLLLDPGIVRKRAKIESTINNARAILALERGGIDFVEHLWSFVGGRPIENAFSDWRRCPPRPPSRGRCRRTSRSAASGFVGPTTCYSFMQSAGLVNDHVPACYRHAECAALA